MTAFQTVLTLVISALGVTGIATLYSLLRAVKRSTRATLDRA